MAIARPGEVSAGAFSDYGNKASRRYFPVLLMLLALYAVVGKGFAYLGYPPFFVGDAVLVVGCLIVINEASGALLGVICSLPAVTLILLMLWGMACALPYLGQYQLLVIRDWMVLGYGAFAFIIAALVIRDPALLRRLILCYRSFVPYLVMGLPVVVILAQTVDTTLVWPGSGEPVFQVKFGDVAVQLAGVASLAIVGLSRLRPIVFVTMSFMVIVAAAVNRGGATAFFVSTFAACLLSPRGAGRRQYLLFLAVLALLVATAAVLDVRVHLSDTERTVSARQLVYNALSVAGDSDGGDLTEATKMWRLEWWHEITNYTFHGSHFWFGKGFGINLADADGFQVGDLTAPLRSPHNVNMTILARAGVPGLLLWICALGSWLGLMCHRLIIARRSGDIVWMRFFPFLICFWLAFLINASFDVALEGPTAGIWFWTLHGIGIAAAIVHRTEYLRSVVTVTAAHEDFRSWRDKSGVLTATVLLIALSVSARAEQVTLHPGENLQAAVSAAPPGTTFTLAAGVFREQTVRPKDNDTFVGRPDAVLNGARLLTGFKRSHRGYYTEVARLDRPAFHGVCQPGWVCDVPNDLFVDGARKRLVTGTPANGQYSIEYPLRRVYLGDDPAGHVVELAMQAFAFIGNAKNVTLRGISIANYASPAQEAAVGGYRPGVGWRIIGSNVYNNHAAGIRVADRGAIANSHLHDNGQLGATAAGSIGAVIEGNEIDHNNSVGFDPGWEAGGVKAAFASDLILENNYVHDNDGSGLWTDIDGVRITYRNNRIENNSRAGIQHEISHAAVVAGNVLRGNGFGKPTWGWGAQILIQNSDGVEVHDNDIQVTANGTSGIILIDQDRGSGPHGLYRVSNTAVCDNTVTDLAAYHDNSGFAAALLVSVAGRSSDTNSLDRNTYVVTDTEGAYWAWPSTAGTRVDWQVLRQLAHQELHGHLQSR